MEAMKIGANGTPTFVVGKSTPEGVDGEVDGGRDALRDVRREVEVAAEVGGAYRAARSSRKMRRASR